ncbi:biliverdin-producing heme oxygenase [Arenibaculum pallidiluteum]|uniref:biliverdin-producing heme oxygenase n=1 Tax=Arenibaculum pallidiluteum TaxID=2812559 RepID=UPI001A959D60|nr:biliverdin-producing heme oxygenase [Arenibaculum pallidiluteum]
MLQKRLRQETAEKHRRLEEGLGLVAPDLTLGRYRRILEGFYTFLRPWEAGIETALGDPAFTRPRRRAHLLAADLVQLGAAAGSLAALPDCPALPLIDGPARAMGSLYVMEGSTLGGRIVARHVEKALCLSDGRGYTYFSSHGPAVGAMWRRFLDRLAAFSSPDRDDQVVAAAQETFDSMERWLCGSGGASR